MQPALAKQRFRSRVTGVLCLLIALPCVGCERGDDATGVELTVRYGDPAPSRLQVSGRTTNAKVYGPNLLPDPPRPLSPAQESVRLELAASMGGQRLLLEVVGLDQADVQVTRAAREITILRGELRPLVITLPPIVAALPVECDGRPCPTDAGTIDAGSTHDAGGPLDAGRTHDAGGPLDAAVPTADAGATCTEDCGDGVCCAERGEDSCTCALDCGSSGCGDGLCCARDGENACSCGEDCPVSRCGDKLCCPARGENARVCAADCVPECGDGVCTTDEDACRCPADCSGEAVCGDDYCCAEGGEDRCSCAVDCGAPSCGDGVCCASGGENECSCPDDCGAGSCGDGVCCASADEDTCSCAEDCGAELCGNGVCCAQADEDPCSCSDDCGPTPSCDLCAAGCCGDGCGMNGCTNTCDGCDCDLKCEETPGTCALTCTDGSDCKADCRNVGSCLTTCTDATCAIDCRGADQCTTVCGGESTCNVKCNGSTPCDATCTDGARCLIECNNNTAACGFSECTEGAASCPHHVIVCNRECP